jgi:serine/threonine protein kinase
VSEGIFTNTTIDQYEIISKIGEGGMGVVYRARDTRLGRDVAIKILPASLSKNTDRLTRFERESRAAGSLNHPNILVIHDIGTHQGEPYMVSDFWKAKRCENEWIAGR